MAVLAAVVAVSTWGSFDLSAQTPDPVPVRGQVVDGESGHPVAGALVRLEGLGDRITDLSGAFSFEAVAPGTYTFSVQMLGYEPFEEPLEVEEEVRLQVGLVRQPVALDTLLVEVRDVTVEGRVRAEESGRNLHRARVLVRPDHEEETDVAGRFRIRGIRTASPITVEVHAFGYMPAIAVVPPDIDEPLEFDLAEDPIARAMVARQMERLDERLEAAPTFATVFDREDILMREGWSAANLVRSRLGHLWRLNCLIVDEREITPDADGEGLEDYLETILATDVERMELHRHDRMVMVRVYTRSFVREMLRGNTELGSIQILNAGGRPFCS
jgi:hypothetical protein